VLLTCRYALRIACTTVFWGLLTHQARADALYSVTDLGPASPSAAYLAGQSPGDASGSYLSALNPGQQAAFLAGSFDVYAHPATGWDAASQQNPDRTNVSGSTNLVSESMVTANNAGSFAGTGFVSYSGGATGNMVVVFTSDPHTVAYNSYSPYAWAQQGNPSNGYLNTIGTISSQHYGSFYGSVSGINDHNVLAATEGIYVNSSVPGNNVTLTNQTPHLIGSNGDVSLGSLGGTNGVANALNNSNDVVGWSQLASGAQHAFLYSNGTMQDLNSLIPPGSGVSLVSAVGIDSAGEIVAFGTNASGQMHEYFVAPSEAPVPEPSTLAAMSLMIVGLALRHALCRRAAKG
jgi:probable HAF family extracellular repeat protein